MAMESVRIDAAGTAAVSLISLGVELTGRTDTPSGFFVAGRTRVVTTMAEPAAAALLIGPVPVADKLPALMSLGGLGACAVPVVLRNVR